MKKIMCLISLLVASQSFAAEFTCHVIDTKKASIKITAENYTEATLKAEKLLKTKASSISCSDGKIHTDH